MPRDISAAIDQFTNQMAPIWQSVSVALSEQAGTQFNLANPFVTTSTATDLLAELGAPSIVIQFHFANSPENPQVLLIPHDPAFELAASLLDKDLEDLNDEVLAPIRPHLESIVQGICLGLSNLRNEPFIGSGVSVRYLIFSFPPSLQSTENIVRTNVAWEVNSARGNLIWLIDEKTLLDITGRIDGEVAEAGGTFEAISYPTSGANALAPEFATAPEASLDLILDIPLNISVELGRVQMQVKEVIEMGTGSIVELDRVAGEPVDVLVNGRAVARGEVVVIEDNFGVRITEIITPTERLKRLGDKD